MGLKYAPVWSAELNLVLCSHLEVQIFRDCRDDHTTASRYVKHVFDFEEKPHRQLADPFLSFQKCLAGLP